MHAPVVGPLEPWLTAELATVPAFSGFLGADRLEAELIALHDEFPDVTTLRSAGRSRWGDPISALQIGTGSREALVFALPHPNEPIGGLTALHLARRLCQEPGLRARLDLRWTVISCIDPDGLRLNEGWLDGPFTRTNYAKNFYRPAGPEQVEWTFPLDHRGLRFDSPLPETLAVMRLIDELRPALMVSLHNSELGGAYYYLSRPEPGLYGTLQSIPAAFGIGLDQRETEHPSIPVLAAGILHGLSLVSVIDYLYARDIDHLDLAGGDCSGSYASKYGTLTLLSEVPYWTDPRSTDDSPTDAEYGSLLAVNIDEIDALGTVLGDILTEVEPWLTADSPFLHASRFFATGLGDFRRHHAPRLSDPANHRAATRAEMFSLVDTVHCYRLRFGGMLLRVLDGELAIGNRRKVIRDQHRLLTTLLQGWYLDAEAMGGGTVLPIRDVVGTQYGAILATAAYLGGAARGSL